MRPRRRLCSTILVWIVASLALAPTAVEAVSGPASRLAATAAWVKDENDRPGTTGWKIPAGTPKGIVGYADHVSAVVGDTVTLYVDTKADTFHVEAYRLGWYHGDGGRLIWTSDEKPGIDQPKPTITADTNMVETDWAPSISVSITPAWVEGSYVFKLVSSSGGQSYAPFIVRNDQSHSALVFQHQVATWQAYNKWGGASLYKGVDNTFASRSRIVSFDRPYGGRGAGALLHTLPFIAIAEEQALDLTYWTDIDLHERASLLLDHDALITLDHDEYWSTAMRDGATAARDAGVNLAFLGANAVYRHIRLEPSRLGPDRHVVCYKNKNEDPLYGIDDAEVTVSWRNPPVNRPESDLLGPMYDCPDVHGDLVVADAGVWVFAGTGLRDGNHIAGAVDMEVDRIFPDAPTPQSIQILAHSPVDCPSRSTYADMTYYTTHSDAGVLDVSSQGWVKKLRCAPPVVTSECGERAVTITMNILNAFAEGPVGVTHPSSPNASSFGYTLTDPIDP